MNRAPSPTLFFGAMLALTLVATLFVAPALAQVDDATPEADVTASETTASDVTASETTASETGPPANVTPDRDERAPQADAEADAPAPLVQFQLPAQSVAPPLPTQAPTAAPGAPPIQLERDAAIDAYFKRMLWNDPGRARREFFSWNPEYGLFHGQNPKRLSLDDALRSAGHPDVADATQERRTLILWGKSVPVAGLFATGIAALLAANATGIGISIWSDVADDTPSPRSDLPVALPALAVMLGGTVAGLAAVLAGAAWMIAADALWGREIEPEALNAIVTDYNAELAGELGLNPIDDPLPSGVVDGELQEHPLRSCLGLGCMSCSDCHL